MLGFRFLREISKKSFVSRHSFSSLNKISSCQQRYFSNTNKRGAAETPKPAGGGGGGWTNPKVRAWIDEVQSLCQPSQLHFCDGSVREYDALVDLLIRNQTLEKLDRPSSYLAKSDPKDVARVEKQTYICSDTQEDAGPTNNWESPEKMRGLLQQKFDGCMKGRTMYVVPFSMGPVSSPLSKIGLQVTDSPYVVLNMRIMTRMGAETMSALGDDDFIPCIHSVGAPLLSKFGISSPDVPWPCSDEKYIVHFPETREIWSYGSGYGGNALLGKKCLALRIASVMGREEGWLAEHMLILALTSPAGERKYIAAAFPSACGKTNLALMSPSLPGWKVEVIGDDIAWMKIKEDGRLYAINPENGFFGVVPGLSPTTTPNAFEMISKDTLFTNVAKNPETNDVWWEGMSKSPPSDLIDWRGDKWDRKGTAAHPNARFTAAIENCPMRDPSYNDPEGVPISAILFGGRRTNTIPLVTQAKSWQHGTFMGVSVASEQTAAAEGKVGDLRHDPFAMLPFCGYNMADYFDHWLSVPSWSSHPENLPKIFFVNWFRKNEDSKFIWPGFGENCRVLEWIFHRSGEELEESAIAKETEIGFCPTEKGINLSGLDISSGDFSSLLHVDRPGWKKDLLSLEKFLEQFGDRVPEGVKEEMEKMKRSFWSS